MNVVVNSAELLPALVAELRWANCLVQPLDATSCRVTPLDAGDPQEALVELRFYVATWAHVRPGAVAVVVA
jgi:hypothetical protein